MRRYFTSPTPGASPLDCHSVSRAPLAAHRDRSGRLPRDSHIVGDVLKVCQFGYHIEHGDVEGFLRVIELVRNLTPEEVEGLKSYWQNYLTYKTDYLGEAAATNRAPAAARQP